MNIYDDDFDVNKLWILLGSKDEKDQNIIISDSFCMMHKSIWYLKNYNWNSNSINFYNKYLKKSYFWLF